MKTNRELIDSIAAGVRLEHNEWLRLLSTYKAEDKEYSCTLARKTAVERFGRKIYFRGIIEFTNICKNNCLYCGIRRSNQCVERYRLTKEQILECCEEGYTFGYRTFVLQGGEDPYWNDERLVDLVSSIHSRWPDCAVTLSVGERSKASYQALYDAGASRYLLRHETADPDHYRQLHPVDQTYENRMRCLRDLKDIGYQTGAGMMIGSPFQTFGHLASDMEFLAEFQPQMVGIGPFIPHKDTPFRDRSPGSSDLTVFILSLVRLTLPDVLLPATTALGTVRDDGRQQGVLAGCNVIMPNLSPMSVREKYLLYDNKAGIKNDAKSSIELLRRQMDEIGYEVVANRGDFKKRSIKHD